MKNYSKPNLKETKFEAIDIIAVSGLSFSKGNDAPSAGQANYNSQWDKYLIK